MFGSAIVYSGLVLAAAGLLLAAKPIRRLRSVTRRRGLVAAGAGALLAFVGLILPASESRVARVNTRLDEFAPVWQFSERHTISIPAPPSRVFAAIRRVRANEIFLFRTLTWIRRGGRQLAPGILNAGDREPLIDLALHNGFVSLADDPPRELVVGTVIAAPPGTRGKLTPQVFQRDLPPGFVLATMNFVVAADGPERSQLSTETRVFANSPSVRRRFAAYWRIIYPGSAIIRRSWLRAIARRATSPDAPDDPAERSHAGRIMRAEIPMRRILLLLLLLLAVPSSAFATWSVIAVDKSTGRVVIASATCVNGNDDFLKGVQAVVVPGKGVAACQAAVDNTHQNQILVFQELQKGTDPKQIIALLSADPAFQSRQFGILDLQGRNAGHSGLTNGYVAQHIQGQVPGTDIFYSIQGNILRPGQVVPNAVQAFIHATGAITDRVMAAMEAADGSGGDSRCTCPPWPADGSKPAIPCDGKTAHVAYILMAEQNDTNGDSHNNGNYTMYINVSQPAPDHARGIKEGENLNPVKTLRMRYDEWRKKQPASIAFSGFVHAAPQTPPPAPLQNPPAQPPPGGQRGGGRGRGGVQVMTLASIWPDGGQVPVRYTQAGDDESPPFQWSNAPDGVASFVLIVHDPDAAIGNGTDDLLHWMVWNIPATVTTLSGFVPQGSQLPDGTRQISATGPFYRGPGPTATPHHYVFELYALDTMLDVPAVGAPPPQTRAAVVAAMVGHVRGKGVFTGVFKRP